MGTLYIIGNGFDLHFGLKTKSDDFIEMLRSQPIYGEVDNAYEILLDGYGVDWSDYENSLADIELDEIEEQNIEFPDYMSDHESDRDGTIYNMQEYVGSIKDAIRAALEEMVDAANEAVEEIASGEECDRILPDASAVLSFNYTSTLEALFDLPPSTPVLHIHGFREDNTPLLFGYSQEKGTYQRKLIPDEDEDFYVTRQRECIYDFYQSMKKKLQINSLKKFLEDCREITQVVVLGHSMGEVDSAYLELIEHTLQPDAWKISFHGLGDPVLKNVKKYCFISKCELFEF